MIAFEVISVKMFMKPTMKKLFSRNTTTPTNVVLRFADKSRSVNMVSLWITIGLVIATVGVSSLGAFFSVSGLGALFSGALVAVWFMAGSLEFAKFMLAAYLHQTWKNLNIFYKSYLTFAIITLSAITSVGIYGFLSDAYQSASSALEVETVKLESIRTQQNLITAEINRLNKMVEEIPDKRTTKRLQTRAEIEPTIKELNDKYTAGEHLITEANLRILEVKKKVGPLIYIAKNFDMNIDRVVSYLILVLVSVFDPLAICLVIATTHSLETQRRKKDVNDDQEDEEQTASAFEKDLSEQKKKKKKFDSAASVKSTDAPEEGLTDENIIVQMNFKDESKDKKAV